MMSKKKLQRHMEDICGRIEGLSTKCLSASTERHLKKKDKEEVYQISLKLVEIGAQLARISMLMLPEN